MIRQIQACWSYKALHETTKYVPQIRVEYHPDGTLASEPILLNPPLNDEQKALADSALLALKRCSLKFPEGPPAYLERWKERIIRFDPAPLIF